VKTKTIFFLMLLSQLSLAQAVEIGQWKDYLPYNDAISVVKIENKVYVATENSLFYVNTDDQSIHRFSKINGLSEVGVSAMEKDPKSDLMLIAYKNCVIDIIQNQQIYSIKDIERENIIGLKKINAIVFYNQTAYIACSFGIVELNIEKKEISNTYYLNPTSNLSVNDVAILNDSIYAATDEGVFVSGLEQNLSDYNNWTNLMNNVVVNDLEVAYNKIYYTTADLDSIYIFGYSQKIHVEDLLFIEESQGRLLVGSKNQLCEINSENKVELIKYDSFLYTISDVLVENDSYWMADGQRSLLYLSELNALKSYIPEGPNSNLSYSVSTYQNELFVSPGGTSIIWNNNNTYQGLYWSNGYEWQHIKYPELDSARDITTILKSPNNDVFVATWNNGVLQLRYNTDTQNYQLYKTHNYFSSSGQLQTLEENPQEPNYGWIRVKGMSFDQNGYLWATNSLTEKSLAFMNTNEEWQSLKVNSFNTSNSHLSDIIIDDLGQKWFVVAKGGGIIVYNDNNTPENESDDQDKKLSTTAGSGALPSNNVFSIAKDRDNEIWVGTDQGVAVFYSPENIFSLEGDAQQVLVEADGYVEPIIASETVNTIAIDGANRKWFGTQNSGVYLYSEDGSEQIHHFNTSNSPLFSNTINQISINHVSGEVFIASDKGLISYRGEATEGTDQHTEVLVYPNPVREHYNGPIAIKNVVENANVKITDINGSLIQSFKALGGQAVWDGKNQFGQRPGTGIYLVFTTNPNGTETNVAKILFIK